jgi:hypothetical protein
VPLKPEPPPILKPDVELEVVGDESCLFSEVVLDLVLIVLVGNPVKKPSELSTTVVGGRACFDSNTFGRKSLAKYLCLGFKVERQTCKKKASQA